MIISPNSSSSSSLSSADHVTYHKALHEEAWRDICQNVSLKALMGLRNLHVAVINKLKPGLKGRLKQTTKDRLIEFYSDVANFPIKLECDGFKHKFFFTRNENSWRVIWVKYLKLLKRNAAFEILHESIEIAEASERNEAAFKKIIKPILDVKAHNRRLVDSCRVSQKLKKATDFSIKLLSQGQAVTEDQVDQMITKIGRYRSNPIAPVVSQNGREFGTVLNGYQQRTDYQNYLLEETTGHAFTFGIQNGIPNKKMEDTAVASMIKAFHSDHIIEDHSAFYRDDHLPFYGVFDGHAGHADAQYLAGIIESVVTKFVSESVLANDQIADDHQLFNFFKLIGLNVGNPQDKGSQSSGSTFTLAFRYYSKWILTCCGDSRALRVCKGVPLLQTLDAKPENMRSEDMLFSSSVQKRGGSLATYWDSSINDTIDRVKIGKKCSWLNMTHSYGHPEESGINPRSQVMFFACSEIADVHDYLILATDGLWDVVTSHEAAGLVQHLAEKNKFTSKQISESLVNLALSRGSSDNITVLIIDLSKHNLIKQGRYSECFEPVNEGSTS